MGEAVMMVTKTAVVVRVVMGEVVVMVTERQQWW